MKFRRLECALLIAVAALFTYAAAASYAQDTMANGLLRLHVVANSDTPRDQEIKLRKIGRMCASGCCRIYKRLQTMRVKR